MTEFLAEHWPWILAGAATGFLAPEIAKWLRGELTKNGKTCRFGHTWVVSPGGTRRWSCAWCDVRSDRRLHAWLTNPCRFGHSWCSNVMGVAWICGQCSLEVREPRLSNRIRALIGRVPRPGLILYPGEPGTLHVASWLLGGALVRVTEGSRLPRGYGIARYAPERRDSICAPVPINWAYAAIWGFWWRYAVRPPWLHKLATMESELRTKEAELSELCVYVKRDLQDGRAVFNALENSNGENGS